MQLSPIILFVYNRPWHTKQTLNALAKNNLAKESILYMYVDGAKPNATNADLQSIKEVRKIISTFKGCKEIYIIEREKNYGLATNIIDGVTQIINKHGNVIVLEDDLITSPFFLKFMNDALSMYQTDSKVWSIGACNFFSTKKHTPDTFFIPIPDCWGWATWKDRWELFEQDSNKLVQKLIENNLTESFDLYGNYPFIDMLKAQAEGKVSSWAIRWQAQAYLHNALSLYPKYPVTEHLESENATNAAGYSTNVKKLFPKSAIKVKKENVEVDKKVFQDMQQGYNLAYNQMATVTKPTNKISMQKIKNGIKLFLPPIILKIYHKFSKIEKKQTESITTQNILPNLEVVTWSGNYPSWQEAKENCTGYDNNSIIEKVVASTLKVKNGEAVYERDSVLFDEVEYNLPLLATLLNNAISNQNTLSIVDFGGSLGSTYFQNKQILASLKKVDWIIVEQEHFVSKGKEYIQNNELSFAFSIEEALREKKASILLLSGVIQYLDNPYEWIEKFLSYNFEYIIVDRTAFIESTLERITIQNIHEPIYEASYPAWFFNEVNFIEQFTKKYELVTNYEQLIESAIYFEDGIKGYWNGFLFKKRK